MEDDKMELEIAEEENPQAGAEMSDDDVAASLGFMTTLTERGMTPPEDPTDMQEDKDEEQESIEGDTDGTPKKDAEQDEEIAQIKAQLEQLLAQENGQETNDTELTETAG